MNVLFAVTGVSVGLAEAADVPLPWWGQALVAIAGAVTTFLLGLAGRALNQLFDYLAEKTRIAKLTELDELIMGFVSEVAQEKVKKLKEASADGKLSPAEIVELKKIPVDKVMALKGAKYLTKLLGDHLDQYLASRVERAVVALKLSKPNP